MPIINITISIEIPDGVEVGVTTSATEAAEEIAKAVIPRLRDTVGELAADTSGKSNALWTRGEDLIASDMSLSDEEVAQRLGRSAVGVHWRRRDVLGLVPKKYNRIIAEAPRAQQRWTKAEVEFLTEYAQTEPRPALREVADAMGRTFDSCQRKAWRLGLIAHSRDWR